MRILIVEDEIKIRRGMANLIANHTEHAVVGEAKNGEEGLAMAMQFQPDLIITDIRMPVMNGLEMIKALHEKGAAQHCVILSGYSEFEYAKQAIRYGVDDYLIKPLAPEDITSLLNTVEKKISKELMRQQGTPENLLRDYMQGQGEPAAKAISSLELAAACGFRPGGRLYLVGAYLGDGGQDGRKACIERFEKLKAKFPDQKFCWFFVENTREFVCVTEGDSWVAVKGELEQKLLQNGLHNYDWVWAETAADSLEGVKRGYQEIQKWYLYGMTFGRQHFLDGDRIRQFEPEEYQYPNALEHQMQNAVYSGKKDSVTEAGREFMEAMSRLKIKPDHMLEGYMRMVNFLMELCKESSPRTYEQLQTLNLMKNVGLAVTRQELEHILAEEIRMVTLGMNQREDISNYTIKRAIDYIRNHYQEGISLEMVGASLDITPEYLSTLFNREMGINFSVFLKKFRISHAKRLLKGTDKKIYEIAQEVGYSDAKYFNRVFKEEEGVSPGDFRGLH